jgi:hypothetical protein
MGKINLKLISNWWRQTSQTYKKNCHREWRTLWVPLVCGSGVVLPWVGERKSKKALPGSYVCWIWKGDRLQLEKERICIPRSAALTDIPHTLWGVSTLSSLVLSL